MDQGTGNEPPIPQWSPPEAPSAPIGGPPPAPPGTSPAWGPPTWPQGAPPAAPPSSGGRAWWPWILGAVGVIAVFGVVAVLVSSGDDDGDTDEGGQAVATEGGDGDIFEDPQGEYTIELHPDWEQGQDVVSGLESFTVAPPEESFAPNLNIVAANDAPGGIGEDVYVESAGPIIEDTIQGATILDSGVVEGSDGTDRGYIEYTASFGDGLDLHFLAIIDVAEGQSVIVTLTAPETSFDELRAEAEPYMRTVRAS